MSFMRAIGQSSPALASRAGVREQRHLARVLDRRGDVALVPGAVTGDPARADLAAVRDVLAEQAGVLVVHVADLVVAEGADLLLGLANWWLRHRGAPLESPANAGMVITWLLAFRTVVRRSSRRRTPTGPRSGRLLATGHRSSGRRSSGLRSRRPGS